MHAILLIAHKGIDYIENFCKQFDNDNDFQIYIHYDAKNHIEQSDIDNLKKQFSNIRYFCSKFEGKYFDFSLVEIELLLIKEALKDNHTYCHLMSEQCYLTTTLQFFKDFFTNNNNEYIQIVYMLKEIANTKYKLNYWRNINNRYFYFGSQWWSLTSTLLNKIINHPKLDEYIYENIVYSMKEHRQAVDETFFQSFIMHYDLYNEDSMLTCNDKISSSLRYVDWEFKEHSNKDHPATLGTLPQFYDEQFIQITMSKSLIIRKIDFKNKNSIKMLNDVKTFYKKHNYLLK